MPESTELDTAVAVSEAVGSALGSLGLLEKWGGNRRPLCLELGSSVTCAACFPFTACLAPSSLSQWVHACDALELKPQDREQLDAFIDQLYKDIEAGW